MSAVTITNNMIEEVLRAAVSSLFVTMAGTEPLCKRAEESDEFSLAADVAGVMCLAGTQPAVVACGGSEDLARNIVGRMTGVAEEELSGTDIADGLGEVVNIICGFIKTQCPEMEVALTPPLAVSGKGCSLIWKAHRPVVKLDFDVDGNKLTVVAGL